jgi:hypothetical protein
MSDMTLAWLQANGATSPAIPDAWREMLDSKGFGDSGEIAPNGYVNIADGLSVATFPRIIIGAGEDFELSFDYIRANHTTSTGSYIWRDSVDDNSFAEITDTDHPTIPSSIYCDDEILNGVQFTSVLAGVALGQHTHITISRVGTVKTCTVDGVATVIDDASFQDRVLMDGIGHDIPKIALNSAFQNYSVKNLTTGESWFFPLNEGTGTVINETVQGANGAWVPNVDWQYIQPFTQGQRNTGWFDLLRSLGYTGSLNDMELQFWEAGGTFP